MHDIGGARAVVSDVHTVEQIVAHYQTRSRMKHELIREDAYIAAPQSTGYRGHHLVYRYVSDKTSVWNGLRIELQVRSAIQHSWATAVETVGTFTRQALKSSRGEDEWLRFFALMGSMHALTEGTPTVPGTPTERDDIVPELRALAGRLAVIERLSAYGAAISIAQDARKGDVFVLELDASNPDAMLRVRTYDDASVAAEEYNAIERAIEGDPAKDAVLVSVDSMMSLRRAYPNYFLDTSVFLESVRDAIA